MNSKNLIFSLFYREKMHKFVCGKDGVVDLQKNAKQFEYYDELII